MNNAKIAPYFSSSKKKQGHPARFFVGTKKSVITGETPLHSFALPNFSIFISQLNCFLMNYSG